VACFKRLKVKESLLTAGFKDKLVGDSYDMGLSRGEKQTSQRQPGVAIGTARFFW
jgi:hypothetical protein